MNEWGGDMERRKGRARRRNKAKQGYKKLIILGLASVAVIGATIGGTVFFSYSKQKQYVEQIGEDMVTFGVSVGDIDVSGFKKEELEKRLIEEESKYQNQKVFLLAGEETIELTAKDMGIAIKDKEKIVEEALSYAKEGDVWARYKEIKEIEKNKKVIPMEIVSSSENLQAFLSEQAEILNQEVVNATLKRENGEFIVTDSVAGMRLNIDTSYQKIMEYMNSWDKQEARIELDYMSAEPEYSTAYFSEVKDVLGVASTHCGTGGGRVQNIRVGTDSINGKLLMPGEEYSANAAMEPYTTEKGYTKAGAFENGEVVESMGGGICQVSTTLYNAVLHAELEIVERFAHSMTVAYVEPSMDAAIAGTYKDLKIRNNQEYPVYIEGYINNGTLTFKIYGKETRVGREVKFISETLSVTEAETVYEESSAALGTLTKAGSGHTGRRARLWKVVYQDGVEVSRDVINNSNYNVSNVVVSVGTATDNAEAAAAVRAAIATQDKGTIDAAIAQAHKIIEEAGRPQPPEESPQENNVNEGNEQEG